MAERIDVQLHIVVKRGGRKFLEAETILLLQEIQSGGSLRTAAKELNMSYQRAWNMIHGMNSAAQFPLVVQQRGGSGGGGAILTEYGKKMLEEYRLIEMEVQRFVKKLNTEINL
jgi:molybdate transport system regulatory protein